MERESRKLNVTIRGLETNFNNAERDVKKLLGGSLNLSDEVVDVHFIPPREQKPMILIVRMKSMEAKNKVLSLKRELTKSLPYKDVFIDHHLTPQQSTIAWKIRQQARSAERSGRSVIFTYNRLTIDKIIYRWNERTQEMVPTRTMRTTPRQLSPLIDGSSTPTGSTKNG